MQELKKRSELKNKVGTTTKDQNKPGQGQNNKKGRTIQKQN
nr:hypothetical protein [Mycoplasmopsis bovis]